MNLGIETETLEFKKTTSELKEACVSINAMLNKHGVGTLYFGVKNNGEPFKQDISEASLREISQKISQSIKPQIYPTIFKEKIENVEVIKVEFNGNEKPYSAYGRYYLRVADEDQQMSAEKLRNFFIEHNVSIWEQLSSSENKSDIDLNALKKFVNNAIKANRLPETIQADKTLLEHLGLFKNQQLNNAGRVLFSKNANIWLKMAIFATDEKLTFLDIASEQGNIINLLERAEIYIMKNIRWRAEFPSLQRVEIPEIPLAVVREALANSFAHALYNSNSQHEICIHPNMLTIYNPGSYASYHSPEDYIERNLPSFIRNELIAKTLYLNKSIENFGSGFKRMNSLCREAGISFTYEKFFQGFRLIIHRNKNNVPTNVPTNDSEKLVLSLIKENPNLTKAEIAKTISKSERTVQRYLKSLKEKGLILRVGEKKNGYWIVKN